MLGKRCDELIIASLTGTVGSRKGEIRATHRRWEVAWAHSAYTHVLQIRVRSVGKFGVFSKSFLFLVLKS